MAGLALGLGLAMQAHAQSITGGLYGTTAEQGVTVEVTRPATGFAKTIGVNQNGQYSLGQLSPGVYQVKILRDGEVLSTQTVSVVANASSAVPGQNDTAATDLGTVTVSASHWQTVINPIDVSTPELSTIYTADLLADLPVSQNSIYQLARLDSGTAMGERYAQIGGASETENRYYYNEFDTTYDVTGMGAIIFPQVAVASTQLITGSGGLGWTSTTGGISSATLKQGSNEVHGGYSLYYTPPTSSLLRPQGNTVVNPATGRPTLMQSYNRYGHGASHYVWGSGPLIKDRLFAYVMIGANEGNDYTTYNSTGRYTGDSDRREGLINLTWNITDDQSLNVAAYKTRDESLDTTESNQTSEWQPDQTTYGSPANSWLKRDSKLVVANYNWRINDDLRWRVMGGTMRYDYKQTIDTSGVPYITSYDYSTNITNWISAGHEWEPLNYYYEKDGVKSDIVWNMGNHEVTLGGEYYRNNYYYVPQSNSAGYMGYELNGSPGWIWTGTQWQWNTNPNLMWDYTYTGGGAFKSEQRGIYLYDNWQVSENVRLMYGGRWDQMESFNAAGEGFLDLSVFSPRVGLSWDVNGDSSLKVGANVGRYTLPMPSTLAYLVGSTTTYLVNYYTVDGINADGSPINAKPLYGYGYENLTPEMAAVSSRNLENTVQNEFQVYLQKELSRGWSFLGQAAFHDLKRIVDQTCDTDGRIGDYVRANGHASYAGLGGGQGCIEFNPGSSIVLRDYLDGGDALQDIAIPNSYLGFEKAKRRYLKLGAQLSHQRSESEPYYFNLSYTWSHRYGNHDGYTNLLRSTNANPGISGNYQFLENTYGSNGNLSGDQRHNLVATGVYYFDNGFRVGSVLRYASGQPMNCLGHYPGATAGTTLGNAGAAFHYCNGEVVSSNKYETDSLYSVDLSLGYDLHFGANKSQLLSIDVSVTNLTNADAVTNRNRTSTSGFDSTTTTGLRPNVDFNTVTGMQAPRSTNLYVRYSF
ncbi:putative TonB-dependent outer membrane receptor oar-like transmembrane protein [uncultured Stenotrophomonas sp.]|uniref:Putative TonB-dependent outer membrane receptor oar-like transmembrane protein n=1 Tax=uncultured Stenotrophomonas sp. TaxID=165438 RepID=A0A1Y5Q7I9_9GAMM|nr:putative TonB-dependent outer membrane receptor oar-like transmembrane protein [uncultured Stenotrophomonas sp.]